MSSTPFYKNTKDTLDEVGITLKQLTHWRQEGLFTPELGDNKRYTKNDIDKLKYLKRLIDKNEGYGLDVGRVRQLLSTTSRKPNWVALEYLELSRGRLLTGRQVFSTVATDVFEVFMDEETILSVVLLKLLQLYKRVYKNPTLYEAHREELFKQLRHIDLLARVTYSTREPTNAEYQSYADSGMEPPEYEDEYDLNPRLPSDPPMKWDELQSLWQEQEQLLRRLASYEEQALPF